MAWPAGRRHSVCRVGRWIGIAGPVGLAYVGLACASEPPGPPTCLDVAPPTELPALARSYMLEGLEVRSDRAVCAGTLAAWEDQRARVGAVIDGDQREVAVHLLKDAAAVSRWCGPELGTRGCMLASGVVFSRVDSVAHELAHAAACTLHGEAADYLAEGFATAYDGRVLRAGPTPAAIVAGEADRYATGHFVGWLIEAYGAERFRALYAAVGRGDDAVAARAWFEAVYDEPFAGLAAAYAADAPAVRLQAGRCDHPAARRDGAGWTIAAALRCDDPGTFGPHPDDLDAVYVVRVLELPADATLQVAVEGTARPYRLESCDADNLLSPVRVTSDARDRVRLRAGRYRVELLGDDGAAVSARFTPRP